MERNAIISPSVTADGPRWSQWIFASPRNAPAAGQRLTIGVLPGEGSGPEVVAAAMSVLRAVTAVTSAPIQIVTGGEQAVSWPAERRSGLHPDMIEFCASVFAAGGAILAGAIGGRFVYDLRREFDLYCKLNPLVPCPELRSAGCTRPGHAAGVDVLIVRDNAGGVYQGRWSETADGELGRTAHHSFSCSEAEVRRVLTAGAAIAGQRRGELALVVKSHGIPAISRLWLECAREIAHAQGTRLRELEVDYAVYQLIQEPGKFDVMVTTNLFGDILSDVGGVLLGSRGMCYGGSFSSDGAAVFQTNHGAAQDLAGTDQANPLAQILSLAMLLRESFALAAEAGLVEAAVADALGRGVRTRDIAEDGCRIVGTREMADRVVESIERLAGGQV